MLSRAVGLGGLLLLVRAAGLSGQAAPANGSGSPSVSFTLSAAAIGESYNLHSFHSPIDWYPAAAIGLRLAMPLSPRVASMLHVMHFQAADNRQLQVAVVGLQFLADRAGHLPITIGLGAVRQPDELVFLDFRSDPGRHFVYRTRVTLELGLAYEQRLGARRAIGPEVIWTRTLAAGQLYHSLQLGLRLRQRL